MWLLRGRGVINSSIFARIFRSSCVKAAIELFKMNFPRPSRPFLTPDAQAAWSPEAWFCWPAEAALSPTRSSSSGTPTATLPAVLPAVLIMLVTLSLLGGAMPAPPPLTLTLAVVLTLSLRGLVLASLALRSRTKRSNSLILLFKASFSRFTVSNSCRWNAVSSYLDVTDIMLGDIISVEPEPGVACVWDGACDDVPVPDRRWK